MFGNSFKRSLVVAGLSVASLFGFQGVASATDVWTAIAWCESGGRNIPNSTGSSASGYFQITDGTWRAHGGRQFARRAIWATRSQQFTVAKRIKATRGSFADWSASRHCWAKRVRTG